MHACIHIKLFEPPEQTEDEHEDNASARRCERKGRKRKGRNRGINGIVTRQVQKSPSEHQLRRSHVLVPQV